MQEQIKKRTKRVGLEVIKLLDELPSKPSAWAIAKQIVRSSTSIGANYRAACRAKSAADFINKLKIVWSKMVIDGTNQTTALGLS